MRASTTTILLFHLTLSAALALTAEGCEAPVEQRTKESGIEMTSVPANNGWMLSFVGIKGRATEVVVRFGDKEDDQKETYRGTTFPLPPQITDPTNIWLLSYKLGEKTVQGPFRFRFDPRKAYTETAKDSLDMLRTTWVTWTRQPSTRDHLQTAFLTRHSCGIERIEYGFGEAPDTELPLPKCKDPGANWEYTDMAFPANEKEHVVIRITFADGEQTPVRRFPNPNYDADDPLTRSRAAALEVFEDVLSRCTRGAPQKSCQTAARRPDLSGDELSLRKGFERLDIVDYCGGDNYIWLKADIYYDDDAHGTVFASFMRTGSGKWAAGQVYDDAGTGFHDACEGAPFSSPEQARKDVFPITPRWKASTEAVHLSLPGLSKWRCAIEHVEFRAEGKESPPKIVRPKCWTSDGWSVAEDDIATKLRRSDLDVVVRLRFTDGSSAGPIWMKRPPSAKLTKSTATE